MAVTVYLCSRTGHWSGPLPALSNCRSSWLCWENSGRAFALAELPLPPFLPSEAMVRP